MGENERMDDAQFVQSILKDLPAVAVPAALEQRILADFERTVIRRAAAGWRWSGLGAVLWPGVPLWQPASVLALSLIVGLAAGAAIPSASFSGASTDSVIAALDTTSAADDIDKEP